LGWVHSGGPPRAAAAAAMFAPDRANVWSRRFYVHSVCTMLTSGALVALGPTVAFSYDSYILEDICSSRSLPVVVARLQALVTIPLAWTIAVARGVGLIWRVLTRGSAARRTGRARGPKSDLALWILICAAGALATAKIVLSNGFYGINSVDDAVLFRRLFLELVGMALLPMLLKLFAERVGSYI